jgi:hypothetical protein
MAENLGKWLSKRGPISKIRPSDGCGRDTGPLAVERWYDFPEFGGYLGNVALTLYGRHIHPLSEAHANGVKVTFGFLHPAACHRNVASADRQLSYDLTVLG